MRDFCENPVDISQKKSLYGEILRRFIDGIVELGEYRHSRWSIPLSYGDVNIRRKNFNAHEKIGADRTEGFSGMLTGRGSL